MLFSYSIKNDANCFFYFPSAILASLVKSMLSLTFAGIYFDTIRVISAI
jgi:hypothetical protein